MSAWARVSVVEKPTGEVISIADLKARLRIDSDADDADLARMLAGAVARIDGPDGIGFALMAQTWRLTLDAFPQAIALPGAPVKGVSAITYVDTNGDQQTVPSEDYAVDLGSEPARVSPAYGKSWPATRGVAGAVKVEYTLGEESASDVPQDLVDAVCLMVGHRYANREAATVGVAASELPLGVNWVLSQYRRGSAA